MSTMGCGICSLSPGEHPRREIRLFDGYTKGDRIINSDIPSNAVRVFVEKPYAWEYKFLAYVLKGEFDKLQAHRWDFKYGIYSARTMHLERTELLDDVSEKLDEILDLSGILATLLNSVVQEAIGDPGVPSNLDMMIYVSKQLASIYKRMIEWGLYFKSIHTEEVFNNLLSLLCQLPGDLLIQIDEFVAKVFDQITELPDAEDGIERVISLECVLKANNLNEINDEIKRLAVVLK